MTERQAEPNHDAVRVDRDGADVIMITPGDRVRMTAADARALAREILFTATLTEQCPATPDVTPLPVRDPARNRFLPRPA